jgi:hypothetical protein
VGIYTCCDEVLDKSSIGNTDSSSLLDILKVKKWEKEDNEKEVLFYIWHLHGKKKLAWAQNVKQGFPSKQA